MLKEVHVRSSAELADGSPMFPGTWIETWVLMPGAGVWILASFRPAPGARGRGFGDPWRGMTQA